MAGISISDAVSTAPKDLFSEATTKQDLGKDEFLHLLITELQNQDPLNPMENRDFIAQMAQFSSLEQMLNVNTNLEVLQASQNASNASSSVAVLGKFIQAGVPVEYEDENGDWVEDVEYIAGLVDGVRFEEGEPILSVNGMDVSFGDVLSISAAGTEAEH